MKKVKKYLKKAVTKGRPKKYLRKAWSEFIEEAQDFFEDFDEVFSRKRINKQVKQAKIYGTQAAVRPAYFFAEKIDNFLKIIFGFCIIVSGVLASFWGFTRTSELLTALILSIYGRIFMIVIGISYMILGSWKLLNLKK